MSKYQYNEFQAIDRPARQEEMATLLCGSQSKNCWHVLLFAAY